MERDNCCHPQYAVQDLRTWQERKNTRIGEGQQGPVATCSLCGAKAYLAMYGRVLWGSAQPAHVIVETQ